MEGDQEKLDQRARDKLFIEWFGRPGDPNSFYEKLWLICQYHLCLDDPSELADLMQDAVFQLFKERLGGKKYTTSFEVYCRSVVNRKCVEYKREKSTSIDYKKQAKKLSNLIEKSKSNEDINPDFEKKVELFLEYFVERIYFDEQYVKSRTEELIEAGTQTMPSSIGILDELNKLLSKIKKKSRENLKRTDSLDSESDDDNDGAFHYYDVFPDPSGNVEKEVLDRQFNDRLYSCVDELPEELRIPFNLRMRDDLTLDEIVERTGVPRTTMDGRVRKAMRLLAIYLAKQKEYDVDSTDAKKAIRQLQDNLKSIERHEDKYGQE